LVVLAPFVAFFMPTRSSCRVEQFYASVFVLLVLFVDCFLFILVVCFYVMIVERRE
jgi:hypothetical protein